MNYLAPDFKATAFNCPFCNAYSAQNWYSTAFIGGGYNEMKDLFTCFCQHCNEKSLWLEEKMVFPIDSNIPFPNYDLPEDVKIDYNEARNILNQSPRGAAALLRLAIQKLCKSLGEKGSNINEDIKVLVTKGLPKKIQQSLDILRVVGNNAVHPGIIDLKDNRELASALFALVNIIADVMITQPNEVEALYGDLPKNLLESIEKRDKQT